VSRNDLAEKVIALLDDARVEVRCAAALVLGAAGKGDARVPKALARKLEDESGMVRRFVLDALDAVGARGLSDKLAPLLASTDAEVRDRAMRLLAAQGPHAEGALERQLPPGHPVAARRQAAKLLVERGSADALDALLEQIADVEIGEHVLQLLRAHVDQGDAKARALLGARAAAGVQKLGAKGSKKPPGEETVPRLAALLRLRGYLADPKSLPALVAHGRAGLPAPVRLAAIAGMRRLVAQGGGKAVDDAVAALIGWADDADPHVAHAAVDTLRGAHIPEGSIKKFTALAKAQNPDARRLATERLAALSGKSAIPQLIERLCGDDHGLREAAQRSLAGAPEAAGPVLEALAAATSEEPARRLAHVLRAHGDRVPAKALAAFADAVKRRVDKEGDSGVVSVLVDALSHLAPAAWAELLFERAARLRKQERHAEAFAALRPLAHSRVTLTDEQRFTIGLLGLKASGRNLLRSARGADPVLVQFAQLVDTGFPVARQLARQKDLELDDLFTLGFNFVESTDENEKGLGVELLEHVMTTQPRGKLGVAAKNKLRLAGELE
jgi:hypothetical protein